MNARNKYATRYHIYKFITFRFKFVNSACPLWEYRRTVICDRYVFFFYKALKSLSEMGSEPMRVLESLTNENGGFPSDQGTRFSIFVIQFKSFLFHFGHNDNQRKKNRKTNLHHFCSLTSKLGCR